jgi:lysozyme
MQTNSAGLQIIKDSETLRLKAYLCPAELWTIGWGTTRYPSGKWVQKNDTCTREQADAWLAHDVKTAENDVKNAVTAELNENQFSALVSLAYNIGGPRFSSSTLVKIINADVNNALIRAEFGKWKRANGRVQPGLIKRRAREANLYFLPITPA